MTASFGIAFLLSELALCWFKCNTGFYKMDTASQCPTVLYVQRRHFSGLYKAKATVLYIQKVLFISAAVDQPLCLKPDWRFYCLHL